MCSFPTSGRYICGGHPPEPRPVIHTAPVAGVDWTPPATAEHRIKPAVVAR
jgi:hypothetical protein